jgi:uncharacterized membrane protein (DUF106 family)
VIDIGTEAETKETIDRARNSRMRERAARRPGERVDAQMDQAKMQRLKEGRRNGRRKRPEMMEGGFPYRDLVSYCSALAGRNVPCTVI